MLILTYRCIGHLKHVLSAIPPSASDHAAQLKSLRTDSVRIILSQLSEAELSDDIATVRTLLDLLSDRSRLPAKAFVFHEDNRPGYFGTFTRRSRVVRPRKPFARDVVAVDYAYDSGEEWAGEEEGGGDDLAELSDDDKDDDEGSDEMDGWLVDEDEEEVATPIDEREGLEAFPFPPPPELGKGKRKAEVKEQGKESVGDGAKAKKRKVVVPLVPFSKGPCWESEIGNCEYDPFKQYRIHLFNGMHQKFPRTSLQLTHFSCRYTFPH